MAGFSAITYSGVVTLDGGAVVPAGQQIAFYNTADQTVNYERARLVWIGNVFTIATEAAGTGQNRNIQLGTADGSGIRINFGGTVSLMGGAGGRSLITHAADTIGIAINGRITTSVTVPSVDLGNDTFGTPFGASSGTQRMCRVVATRNQSGTAAFTGLEINIAGTGGSGAQLLLDARSPAGQQFAVDANAVTAVNTTALLIQYHDGTVIKSGRVLIGPVDSAGTGRRALYVPN